MLPIRIISLLCRPGRLGQWVAIITVSLCSMSAALGFAWPSGALPKIRAGESGFDLDLNEQSWVVSILFFGNLISPIPSGYLMEHFGGRNSLCITIWLHVISFVIMSTTGGFWPLCIARILQGLWIGLVYTIVPVYIGECTEPAVRGILGTFFGVFLYIGSLAISFIGSYTSYLMLCLIPAMISVALAILLSFIPESPYFYLAKGNVDAARSSITWLRGYCDETVLTSIQESIKNKRKQESSFYSIIKVSSTRKAFIITILLGFIQRTSGLAILLNYTSVTMPDYVFTAEEFTIVLNIVWIVSCLVSGLVMDKFDRRTLMGLSSTGSSLTMFGVTIWFFLRDKTDVDVSSVMWLPFVLLMAHGVAFSFGIVSIPTMMPGEIFSPEIKSKASGLITIWTAVVSGFVLNIYLPIEATVGVYINFLICSVSSLLGLLTAIFIMIETRGRTLEEIQAELQGTNTNQRTIESTRF